MKKIKKFFNVPKSLLYCLVIAGMLVFITCTIVLSTLALPVFLACIYGSIMLVIVALLNIREWHKYVDSKHQHDKK